MSDRPQFSAEDEERGHASMLARIEANQRAVELQRRRARVLSYPEPGHTPSWETFTIRTFDGVVVREDRRWCCEWHSFNG